MVTRNKVKENSKYYVTINTPYREEEYKTRIWLSRIESKISPNAPDYVVFSVLDTPIPEFGYGPVAMPLEWITKMETLHSILEVVLIKDVITIIDLF